MHARINSPPATEATGAQVTATCAAAARATGAQAAPVRVTGPADPVLDLARDREGIALDLNDTVVRRLFAVGLDLQAALGLLGKHPASARIFDAVGELDQAVRDIRDAVFGPCPP